MEALPGLGSAPTQRHAVATCRVRPNLLWAAGPPGHLQSTQADFWHQSSRDDVGSDLCPQGPDDLSTHLSRYEEQPSVARRTAFSARARCNCSGATTRSAFFARNPQSATAVQSRLRHRQKASCSTHLGDRQSSPSSGRRTAATATSVDRAELPRDRLLRTSVRCVAGCRAHGERSATRRLRCARGCRHPALSQLPGRRAWPGPSTLAGPRTAPPAPHLSGSPDAHSGTLRALNRPQCDTRHAPPRAGAMTWPCKVVQIAGSICN